jgi:hypothetical protein
MQYVDLYVLSVNPVTVNSVTDFIVTEFTKITEFMGRTCAIIVHCSLFLKKNTLLC